MTTTINRTKTGPAAGVHEKVAGRIIDLLDLGNLPPWEAGFQTARLGLNRNAVSGAPYRGINFMLTAMTQAERGYQDPRWLTFNQAKAHGGSVKRGEKGTAIVFWKTLSRNEDQDDQNGNDAKTRQRRPFPFARQYTVFNAEQTDGCNLPELELPTLNAHDPITAADRIIREMPRPPAIVTFKAFNGTPHYLPEKDRINAPDLGLYHRPEHWYCTMFHELVHATGHRTRLNRLSQEQWDPNVLHAYGKEELVAGMGAAMLGALAGIGEVNLTRDAAYIQGWRDQIAADHTIVIRAASLAQAAVDYITGQSATATPSPDEAAQRNPAALAVQPPPETGRTRRRPVRRPAPAAPNSQSRTKP